jgi:hypothetical protein
MPGADYESLLSELAKYGANLVLATQSLARLDALDREHGRGLRPVLFSNLDGLFAFHTSAEDARYLVRELAGGLEEDDLCELGEHRCYAKLSARGERLPVFSVRLDPPPATDPAVADALAAESGARHGRPTEDVERVLLLARERVAQARRGSGTGRAPDDGGEAESEEEGTGVALDAPVGAATPGTGRAAKDPRAVPARTRNRPARGRRAGAAAPAAPVPSGARTPLRLLVPLDEASSREASGPALPDDPGPDADEAAGEVGEPEDEPGEPE